MPEMSVMELAERRVAEVRHPIHLTPGVGLNRPPSIVPRAWLHTGRCFEAAYEDDLLDCINEMRIVSIPQVKPLPRAI